MNILGIQILGLIFGLFFVFITYKNIKKSKLKTFEGSLWILIWLGLVAVSINPLIIDFVAIDLFKMSRSLDFMIVLSFLIMFSILYYMYLIVKNTETRVEKLVRNIAIEELKENTKTKKTKKK